MIEISRYPYVSGTTGSYLLPDGASLFFRHTLRNNLYNKYNNNKG
ncbi:hypothetical protein PAENIP36_65550 [Paenibacillus sp. P36]